MKSVKKYPSVCGVDLGCQMIKLPVQLEIKSINILGNMIAKEKLLN